MIRIARYILIILIATAIAFIGAWLADRPGVIRADWGGYRIETSAAAAAVLLGLFSVLLAGLVIVLRKVRPAALIGMKQSFDRERGYKALSQGLIAIAAGDVSAAEKLGKKAQKLLPDQGATLVLTAQAADLKGDRKAAQKALSQMMTHDDTKLLALRGLMGQAMREGDRDAAHAYVLEAHQMNSKSQWVLDALFILSCEMGHWGAALDALRTQQRSGQIDGPAYRRRRAVVLAAQARQVSEDGDDAAAIGLAQASFRIAPDLSDNAARLVSLLQESGQKRKARATLDQAMKSFPHPDLVALDRDMTRDEKPANRVKRLEKLLSGQMIGDSARVEALLARADAAIAAGLKGQAAELLTSLPNADRTARAWRLLEGLARAEGNTDQAREAVLQAAAAPADPQWICRTCSRSSSAWDAVCPSCHAIDSQDWAMADRASVGANSTDSFTPHDFTSATQTSDAKRPSFVDVAYDSVDVFADDDLGDDPISQSGTGEYDDPDDKPVRQKIDPDDPQSMARQTP